MADEEKLLINLTRGNILCERTLIADTALPRMRGLLGKRALPAGEGMLLQPAPSIHTAFMRFAFDAVFLDGTLRVIRVVERLKPWRAVTVRHAVSVVELAAGEISRRGVEVGDQIIIADPESDAVDDRSSTPAVRTEATATATDVDERDPEPPRVLLVGSDRRFRAVATALLQRRHYAVTTADQVKNGAEIAAYGDVDVVVLDLRVAPAVAALEVARLEALAPHAGFVLVTDGLAMSAPTTAVVQKWGSFDSLCGAIDVVHAAPKPSAHDLA